MYAVMDGMQGGYMPDSVIEYEDIDTALMAFRDLVTEYRNEGWIVESRDYFIDGAAAYVTRDDYGPYFLGRVLEVTETE